MIGGMNTTKRFHGGTELISDTVMHKGRERVVKTYFANPPIPSRDYDYGAIFEDWDLGDIGPFFGPTPKAAIEELLNAAL